MHRPPGKWDRRHEPATWRTAGLTHSVEAQTLCMGRGETHDDGMDVVERGLPGVCRVGRGVGKREAWHMRVGSN